MPSGLPEIARSVGVPGPVLRPAFGQAVQHGYLTGDADRWQVTASGAHELRLAGEALVEWLSQQLQMPGGHDVDDVRGALHRVISGVLEEETGGAHALR